MVINFFSKNLNYYLRQLFDFKQVIVKKVDLAYYFVNTKT